MMGTIVVVYSGSGSTVGLVVFSFKEAVKARMVIVSNYIQLGRRFYFAKFAVRYIKGISKFSGLGMSW